MVYSNNELYLRENAYLLYRNKIYPTFYKQIENTKKIFYNVIEKTKTYYNILNNVKDNFNRIREYEELNRNFDKYNIDKPVYIYGDIKYD